MALRARRSSSKTVLDTIESLNKLTLICTVVRLVWIPSHTGIRGNDHADYLAKLGTTMDAPDSPYLASSTATESLPGGDRSCDHGHMVSKLDRL